jgi:hypothetical protein
METIPNTSYLKKKIEAWNTIKRDCPKLHRIIIETPALTEEVILVTIYNFYYNVPNDIIEKNLKG